MRQNIASNSSFFELKTAAPIMEELPKEVAEWAEKLPTKERSYVLSLCHFLCAATPEIQAEFLDGYTADGLIFKTLQNRDAQEQVHRYLKSFHISTEINVSVLRTYIRQFYIHSAQDIRYQSEVYLESAVRLFFDTEEQNHILSYILGFEIIKIIFGMSWQQHERLYRLQIHQDDFFNSYIKPVQKSHRINGIITPRNENLFFAKRDYFIKKPQIKEKKMIELAMATFNTEAVCRLGFEIIRNANYVAFDYDYIFQSDSEEMSL